MILGLGIPELVIILVVVLVIFGPKNLPKIGSALGKTVKNVREGMEGEDEKIESAASDAAAAADDAVEVVEDDDDADVDEAPAASDDKFCGHCGAKNPAGNAFCSSCGEKLS
ncbi:twin-arginine translocase TatA/TatE family subunit [Paratractidigestivibacter sp.]|uniref:twin-arginine translocase TatA/TatE family subunit n=1 Tax=Paratractidigestivibacter sp. TaxID=2847316 RepID=UPI002ABD4820|nr:twin-arginine translocase TatA/TatE family subunit [Paratractidigestivibacter sp.]